MTSHLPGPDEHYGWTSTGGKKSRGPSDERRFQMRIAIIGAAGAIAAAAIGAVIGLKPWSHSSSSSSDGNGASNLPSGTYSTHLGHALTLTTGTASVTIRLTRIVDPATGDFSPTNGDRYLAAEFTVSDPSTKPLAPLWGFEDATTFVGSDGQTYAADQLDTVSECTSFHNGPVQIVSGQSVTECVVLQMPTGVSVREVQFIDGNERGIWSNP
jgi:hypothetical protein